MSILRSKKLKSLLLLTIFIIIGVIVTVFISYRNILDKPGILITSFNKDAQMSMDRVHQTATKNGRKEWDLDARSAQFNHEKKQALLKDLAVVFFMENGKQVRVTAKQGILKTDTNDIEASGNVVVNYEEYRLNSERVRYQHQKGIVSTLAPVQISGKTSQLTADTMIFEMKTNRALLKGNVKGTFSEHIQL